MRHITIAIFILSFLLYRPYKMQDSGLKYSDDDDAYLSYAISAANLKLPDIGRHPPGSGLLAAPFVFVFSLLDRFENGKDIRSEGEIRNLSASWTLFGFVFSTIFYFWLSCLVLHKTLRCFYGNFESTVAIILMLLLQGIPLYVYRRPVFAHVYELLVQSLLVYALFFNYHRIFVLREKYFRLITVCFLAGMVAIVRYNNVIIAFFWLMAFWVKKDRFKIINRWDMILYFCLVLSVSVLCVIFTQNVYRTDRVLLDYFSTVFGIILSNLQNLSISFYLKRLFHVFFGIDWGLVYTAPFIVASSIWFCFLRIDYKRRLILPLTAVGITFFLFVLSWKSQGAWYGYRYIIFSCIPILALPMADLIQYTYKKLGKRIYLPLIAIALLPFFSMLCFEGNASNLTLSGFDIRGEPIFWGNLTFQLEVWKTFFSAPTEFVRAVFKGGPLYAIYLSTQALGIQQMLPNIVLEKYPDFDKIVLLKSIIIYACPFSFYFIQLKMGRFLAHRFGDGKRST